MRRKKLKHSELFEFHSVQFCNLAERYSKLAGSKKWNNISTYSQTNTVESLKFLSKEIEPIAFDMVRLEYEYQFMFQFLSNTEQLKYKNTEKDKNISVHKLGEAVGNDIKILTDCHKVLKRMNEI